MKRENPHPQTHHIPVNILLIKEKVEENFENKSDTLAIKDAITELKI